MPPSSTKYGFLDYTVSYKAVWTGLGMVVAGLVATVFILERVKPPREDEKARQELKSAERLQVRADGCVAPDTPKQRQDQLEEAGATLGRARTALDQGDFAESINETRAATALLREFIDKTCATRDSVAEFISVTGDVKVKKVQSPRWVPARKDTPLFTGDRIKTGDGQAQYFYLAEGDTSKGETMDIRPGSIVEIKSVTPQPDGLVRAAAFVEVGDVSLRSVPGSGSTLETPNSVVEPKKGDIADVETHVGKEDLIRSRRGGTEVRSASGGRATLDANTRVQVSKAGVGAVVKDLPEPEMVEPIHQRIFTFEKPGEGTVVFEWRELEGAERYLFNLGRNDILRPVLNEGDESVSEPSAQITGLPPGKYFWRLSAVDYNGVPGRWSETRSFSIRGSSGEPPAKRPPPYLEVSSHTAVGDTVIVNGKADPYVTLELILNDRNLGNVAVGDDGSFQHIVPLEREGRNKIEFIARDAYGTETRKSFYENFYY